MNLVYLRKIFEQIGGGASIIGGIVGYEIGVSALANCSNYLNLNGSCPNPHVFAAIGAIPGLFAVIIGLLTRLFK